jgi:hypothetical protein
MASAQDGSRLIRCGTYSSLSRSKQDRLFADALRFLFSPTLVLILMLNIILFQAFGAASAQPSITKYINLARRKRHSLRASICHIPAMTRKKSSFLPLPAKPY